MKKETEIQIYEIAFGIDARPENLNDIFPDFKRESFTEYDLIARLKELSESAFNYEGLDEKWVFVKVVKITTVITNYRKLTAI